VICLSCNSFDRPPRPHDDRKHWAIAAAQRITDGRIHIAVGPYEASWSNTDLVKKQLDIVAASDPLP
jgi:hypothetical protein